MTLTIALQLQYPDVKAVGSCCLETDNPFIAA